MKIMIVEDNGKMRQMIKSILQQHIKKVKEFCECESGEEAVEHFELFSPDVVLMDIRLNNMNGLAAAETILKQNPQAKIIIVTQYSESVYKNKAKKIGVGAYVLKENLQELVNIINNLT
jgi:DNA-binding NarL/FixJ family response regulator